MTSKLAVAALLLALLLAAVACGGGTPQPETGPIPVTIKAPPLPTPVPIQATAAYPAPEAAQDTPVAPAGDQPYPPPATQVAVEPTATAATVEPEPTAAPRVPDAAAIVNGQVIPLAEYQKELARARAFFISEGMADPNTEEGREFLAQVGRQLLEQQLIVQVLMEQAAQRLGITITDADVQASVEAMINEVGGEQAFQDFLTSQGMTMEDFLAQQRMQLLAYALQDEVTGDIGPTAEQVHARHILVMDEAEAQKALARVRAGEDFAKVAGEVSQDATSTEAGGDLGWFARGMMPQEFEEAAFALEPGQVSHIVQTSFGYHIIKVLERDPDRPLSEENIQNLRQQAFLDWLTSERAKASVEILVAQ